MFTPDQMLLTPSLEAELEADTLEECKQFGAIEKLQIYRQHADGVVSIRFRTPDAAQGCISLMHGRFFAGRQVTATLWGACAGLALCCAAGRQALSVGVCRWQDRLPEGQGRGERGGAGCTVGSVWHGA